jgi:hypothetical protein
VKTDSDSRDGERVHLHQLLGVGYRVKVVRG